MHLAQVSEYFDLMFAWVSLHVLKTSVKPRLYTGYYSSACGYKVQVLNM